MDSIVSQFLSKGTLILAIVIVIINFFIKRLVEIIWPTLKPIARELDQKAMYTGKAALVWNQIGLYLLPVLIGVLLGSLIKDPYIFGTDIKAASGRIAYAAIVGWFADFMYEVVQKSLYKTTGVALPDPGASIPPVKDDAKLTVTEPANDKT